MVEPSPTAAGLVSHALKGAGCDQVTGVRSAEEALEVLAGEDAAEIRVVITEWDLPGIDGLELIKQVKSLSDPRRLPVILVTTRNARHDVVEAIGAGVDGYLLKPFSPEALIAHIRDALEQHAEGSPSEDEPADASASEDSVGGESSEQAA